MPSSSSVLEVPVTESTLTALLTAGTEVLTAWQQQPDDTDARDAVRTVAWQVAEALATLPKSKRSDERTQAAVLNLVRAFVQAGWPDRSPEPVQLETAQSLLGKGWPGMMAAMVLTPAWSLPVAPSFEAAPLWLWPDLTRYLFAAPSRLWDSNVTAAYAAHQLSCLDALLRLARTNRGSAAVRTALEAYLECADASPLALSSEDLSAHLTLRGQLLAQAWNLEAVPDPLPLPREGRSLKLGVCLPALTDAPEVRALLAFTRNLSPRRFEVQYFVLNYTYGRIEEELRGIGAGISLIDVAAPQQSLQLASLDVALLAIDPLAPPNALTQLGVCRVAALQIATNADFLPTGLPAIDLSLAFEPAPGPSPLERQGLLPLSAPVCHMEDKPIPTRVFNRESIGIAENARVLVTFAHYRRISSALVETWAQVLAGEPEAALLLHVYGDSPADAAAIQHLCHRIDHDLVARGVPGERVAVLSAPLPAYEDWVTMMSLGDVYLDTHPASDALAVNAALNAELPVVCLTGGQPRLRQGARILSACGLDSTIAASLSDFRQHVRQLLRDDDARRSVREAVQTAKAEGLPVYDSLAASDAFAGLVEAAFDQVCALGQAGFRAGPGPAAATVDQELPVLLKEARRLFESGFKGESRQQLERILALKPENPEARRLMGQVLAGLEQHHRASEYLIACVQKNPRDAVLWYELGCSLAHCGRMQDALAALENSLRLDGNQVDAWLFLGDLTFRAGNASFSREVLGVVRKLAPDDARVAAYARRVDALPAAS